MPKIEKTSRELVLERIEALRECLLTCEKEAKNGKGKLPDPVAQEGFKLSRAIRLVNVEAQDTKAKAARAKRKKKADPFK